ncbi:MAG TPA: hypothetical protein VG273_28160 [Bryobacteraceae bacterium]|nr:hypothetical protein [Bryobacteraceae bacterium]
MLSQVLVAYTIELDNEFERRMAAAGDPGARLSLVVWTNLLRFVNESALPVRDLTRLSFAPEHQIKLELGCLERWSFVILHDRQFHQPGWGSGRGVRADWMVRLTSRGQAAATTWEPLPALIETRWGKRYGADEFGQLRQALKNVASQLDRELPQGLPGGIDGTKDYPARKTESDGLPLPTLLSRLLLTFRLEFDRESPASLSLCANTLRVLGEKPLRLAEIPRLTGGSPETTDIGWQLKPYVIVEPDPSASRGKVLRLSPRGQIAQAVYRRLTKEIENRWEERFGKAAIRNLRESLAALFETPLFSKGLVPPPGTTRAGDRTPALGRRDVGPAALRRMRDLVVQSEAFVNDPVGTLPHYPLWDMNRGFGP